MLRETAIIRRFVAVEVGLCLAVNRRCQRRLVKRFFSVISRLGDGVLWYVLMVALPLFYGAEAITVSLQMIVSGGIALVVYKSLKSSTTRKRPCDLDQGILAGTPPLDLYSFPSGHTLHAVSFIVIVLHYYPALSILLIPACALIAASRVILGLHFPTDVLAGFLIGGATASITLFLFNIQG